PITTRSYGASAMTDVPFRQRPEIDGAENRRGRVRGRAAQVKRVGALAHEPRVEPGSACARVAPVRATRVAVGSLLLGIMAISTAVAAPRDAVRAWRRSHEAAILSELATLAAIPDLSADSADMRRNVTALVSMLERRGLTTSVLADGPWPPAV